ncbi:MAG: LysM peptidoglycan-binding domain-containing protein, partial [Dehalococcoidia bacterium]|nr:LysM peptidoglycan-binding domain-containing protein [Dehalococcoidia bacterium]
PPVTRTASATTTTAASPSPGGSPTAAATPTPGTRSYIVRSGDTLSTIAAENDTTVDAIVALNPGLDPDTLAVGAEILLP